LPQTHSLLTRGKQFGQQVSFIVMSVDMQSPPLNPPGSSAFPHKVASNALALLFKTESETPQLAKTDLLSP
jgi:hypothetical protein